MSYRDIIKLNIRAAILKKEASRDQREQDYWDKIVAALIADLRDYEERERWSRKHIITFPTDLDELVRRFFEEW